MLETIIPLIVPQIIQFFTRLIKEAAQVFLSGTVVISFNTHLEESRWFSKRKNKYSKDNAE